MYSLELEGVISKIELSRAFSVSVLVRTVLALIVFTSIVLREIAGVLIVGALRVDAVILVVKSLGTCIVKLLALTIGA